MSDAVRFLLNGEERTVDGLDPTTTVLEYLRNHERRCGTKEGCAEGDCGACTVVLAEANARGSIDYRAVNSCIRFVPALDGRHLITVEGLREADGSLHPVQRALVDSHGSQCGFCTPGFAMSLFALWHNDKSPTREDVLQVLAGNLCRCTGYRPILDAARHMYEGPSDDKFDRDPTMYGRLKRLGRLTGLHYTAGGKEFLAPRSLGELGEILKRNPDAALLAGGTDFGLFVTKQHREFQRIVWLGEIAELRSVATAEGVLEIGCNATWADALPALERYWPNFGEFVRRFASPPIRNVATIGGNIANASPIGDGPPALMALDASVVVIGLHGEREMPLEEFFVDYRKTALRPSEIVARVRVPLPSPGLEFAAYKLSKRLDQDISSVCAAFALRIEGGTVKEARVAFGGMAATPKRAKAAEAALIGRPWTTATATAAGAALDQDFAPIDDFRASAAYRLTAAKNLLRRFHLETTGVANARIAYG
ncbi:MAG TPA: xanthine dehydrogenase small subunit [Alphaproteobacteria bacterium]